MKPSDAQDAANQSAIVDCTSKFGVELIQSIIVQSQLYSTTFDSRAVAVSIRVFPGDPRFDALETMLRDEAESQKTAAQAKLTALGISVAVDQATLDETATKALEAKTEHEALLERNRLKHEAAVQ